jgi:hypothetical protein
MSGTKFKVKKKITKGKNTKKRFFGTALLSNELYIPTKFHVDHL